MKSHGIYILILTALFAFISCTLEDIEPSVSENEGLIEFVPRSMPYSLYGASGHITKVANDVVEAWERDIYTAYFMAFNADGCRVHFESALDAEGNLISKTLKSDVNKGDVTVCFIANVPDSYARSLITIEAFATTPLSIDYTTVDEYIKVPFIKLDGNGDNQGENEGVTCIPMFGMWTSTLSSASSIETISLQRLFAKVNVNITLDVDESAINTCPETWFKLNSASISNLPKTAYLTTPANNNGITLESSVSLPISEGIKIHDADKEGEVRKSYSFTFYTPEYQPTSTSRIKFSMDGLFHKDNGSHLNVRYNVDLGNSNDEFNFIGNYQYDNNLQIVGTSHLTGTDNRIEIQPLNLVDVYGEAANCYIISEKGTYVIEAYKGVVKNLAEARFSGKPEIVWNDGNNIITLENASITDTKITFTIPNTTVAGNAVIAIKGDNPSTTDVVENEILWSWHLWFCKYDGSRPDDPGNLQQHPKGSLVMNRALGAISNDLQVSGYDIAIWDDGLYYQWGRKDPFRLDNAELDKATGVYNDPQKDTDGIKAGGSYANSIKFPDAFYTNWTAEGAGWGVGKSKNDPCPPGYQVPSNAIWTTGNQGPLENLSSSILTNVFPYSLGISTNIQTQIYLPYVGYVNGEGKFDKADNREGDAKTPPPYLPGESPADKAIIELYQYDMGKDIKRRYRAIKCSEKAIYKDGFFWANNKDAFLYGKKTSQFDIIECEYDEGKVRYVFGIPVGAKWNEKWTTIKKENLTAGEIARIQEMLTTENYLQNFGSSDNYSSEIVTAVAPAKAYPIRCVTSPKN